MKLFNTKKTYLIKEKDFNENLNISYFDSKKNIVINDDQLNSSLIGHVLPTNKFIHHNIIVNESLKNNLEIISIIEEQMYEELNLNESIDYFYKYKFHLLSKNKTIISVYFIESNLIDSINNISLERYDNFNFIGLSAYAFYDKKESLFINIEDGNSFLSFSIENKVLFSKQLPSLLDLKNKLKVSMESSEIDNFILNFNPSLEVDGNDIVEFFIENINNTINSILEKEKIFKHFKDIQNVYIRSELSNIDKLINTNNQNANKSLLTYIENGLELSYLENLNKSKKTIKDANFNFYSKKDLELSLPLILEIVLILSITIYFTFDIFETSKKFEEKISKTLLLNKKNKNDDNKLESKIKSEVLKNTNNKKNLDIIKRNIEEKFNMLTVESNSTSSSFYFKYSKINEILNLNNILIKNIKFEDNKINIDIVLNRDEVYLMENFLNNLKENDIVYNVLEMKLQASKYFISIGIST